MPTNSTTLMELDLEPFLPGVPSPLTPELELSLKPVIEAELRELKTSIRTTFPEGLWQVSFQATQTLIDQSVWLIERLDRLSEPTRRYLVNHPLSL